MADTTLPAASSRSNACLQESIRDAQILLAYASQSGISIDSSVIKPVVAAGSQDANKSMTDDSEAEFWTAFNALAKAVSPVSVGSLRSIMDSEGDHKAVFGITLTPKSMARKAVGWYTRLAIVTLCTLLLVQIYWLFGTAITSDIQKTNEKYSDIKTKVRTSERLAAQPAAAKPKTSTSDTVPANPVNTQQDVDTQSLKAQEQSLRLHIKSSYEFLAAWSVGWQKVLPSITIEGDGNPAEKEIRVNTALFQTSLMVLDVLQRYLLPILYGLLGTCVFVLRTLSSEITSRTYSEASNIGFRIRLYLGMLGGMVFAWFVIPESNDGIFKSLSPFALAFLSGYSVELLFAAMDRFLTAFTTKGQ
jgi:hypothetical protein